MIWADGYPVNTHGNSATTGVGGEHPNLLVANNGTGDGLATGLRALGHTVSVTAQNSGTGTVIKTQLKGAAALVGAPIPGAWAWCWGTG